MPVSAVPVPEQELADVATPASGEAGTAVDSSMTLGQRGALALAVQGVLFARRRRHEDALGAFTGAVRLDPALDLASLDGFWSLPRAGQQAAVLAYEAAERQKEATMLEATLRQMYRPRALLRPGDRPSQTTPANRVSFPDL